MNKSIHFAVLTGILFCAYPFRMKAQYSQLDLPRESQMGIVTQRIGVTDLTAVSYTHLDVYKRQALHGEHHAGLARGAELSGHHARHRADHPLSLIHI